MVVAHHEPQSAAAEAFRVLRTNLQFMGLDQPLKSVVVTSAAPSEGKSTMVANLATAFAQTGANVCLVDADLRRPMIAKLLGLPAYMGLSQAVLGKDSLSNCLRASAIPGVSVLTSGPLPPNPAELLGSARMTALLRSLEDRFDMVLIDTPPLLAVTDAAVLAPRVGGVVLVAMAGQTDRRQVLRAKGALEAVHAKILGVVLQGMKADRQEGYYHYEYQGSRTAD
jgi:capsular exopolysaccharide synthesis family protein